MDAIFKVYLLCRALDCEAEIDGDNMIAFLVDHDSQLPIAAVCLICGAVVVGENF